MLWNAPARPRNSCTATVTWARSAYSPSHRARGSAYAITNCANNYGPYQFPEKVIPLFATNALDDEGLPMYASTQNKREWLHVVDHCEAIDLVRTTEMDVLVMDLSMPGQSGIDALVFLAKTPPPRFASTPMRSSRRPAPSKAADPAC